MSLKGFALFQAIQSRTEDDLTIVEMLLEHPKINIYAGVSPHEQKEATMITQRLPVLWRYLPSEYSKKLFFLLRPSFV
jgi:hypothetical protein